MIENIYYKNKEENIINYDSQGWPLYKMTLRDIIETFAKHTNDGKYIIEENNPVLDIYPRVLEDDGMGYGVNEKNIIEFYPHSYKQTENDTDKKYINIFIDKKLDNLDLWKKSKFYPYSTVHIKNIDMNENIDNFVTDIFLNEANEILYNVRSIKYNEVTNQYDKNTEVNKIYKETELEY